MCSCNKVIWFLYNWISKNAPNMFFFAFWLPNALRTTNLRIFSPSQFSRVFRAGRRFDHVEFEISRPLYLFARVSSVILFPVYIQGQNMILCWCNTNMFRIHSTSYLRYELDFDDHPKEFQSVGRRTAFSHCSARTRTISMYCVRQSSAMRQRKDQTKHHEVFKLGGSSIQWDNW